MIHFMIFAAASAAVVMATFSWLLTLITGHGFTNTSSVQSFKKLSNGAIVRSASSSADIWISFNNGQTWNKVVITGVVPAYVYTIEYGNGIYILGGQGGKVAVSTDGINYVGNSALASTSWGGTNVDFIIYDGINFVFFSKTGGKIAVSTNGTSFIYKTAIASTVKFVIYNPNASTYKFICFLNSGNMCFIDNNYAYSSANNNTTAFGGTSPIIADGILISSTYLIVAGTNSSKTIIKGITLDASGLATLGTTLFFATASSNTFGISKSGSIIVVTGNAFSKLVVSKDSGVTWEYLQVNDKNLTSIQVLQSIVGINDTGLFLSLTDTSGQYLYNLQITANT